MDQTLKEALPPARGGGYGRNGRWRVSYSKERKLYIIQCMNEYSDGWWGGAHREIPETDDLDHDRAMIVQAANDINADYERQWQEQINPTPKPELLAGDY
jgi:hypothetical protein